LLAVVASTTTPGVGGPSFYPTHFPAFFDEAGRVGLEVVEEQEHIVIY